MTQALNLDSELLAQREKTKLAAAEAQAKSDQLTKEDALARSKGRTPEQIEARQRVAAIFCQYHMSSEPPEAVHKRLAAIDYSLPVSTINGRGKDLERPKGTGLLGTGRKPAYFVSLQFPPRTPEDPIYALEYFPANTA